MRAVTRYCAFAIGGAVQVPFSASGFGQYNRIATENGPAGAGNQLDWCFGPGEAC